MEFIFVSDEIEQTLPRKRTYEVELSPNEYWEIVTRFAEDNPSIDKVQIKVINPRVEIIYTKALHLDPLLDELEELLD